jgi:hypothetical protein
MGMKKVKSKIVSSSLVSGMMTLPQELAFSLSLFTPFTNSTVMIFSMSANGKIALCHYLILLPNYLCMHTGLCYLDMQAMIPDDRNGR